MTACTHSATAHAPQHCPWCGTDLTAAATPADPQRRARSQAASAERGPGTADPDPLGAAIPAPARTPSPSEPVPTLFDAPHARRTDPATSHAAAARPRDKAAIHAQVLRLLLDGPLTDFDLARHTGLKQTSVGVRRGELRDAGLVAAHDHAGISDTGSSCIRWALTDAGRMEAARQAAA